MINEEISYSLRRSFFSEPMRASSQCFLVTSFPNFITASHNPPYPNRAVPKSMALTKVWAFIWVASWKGLNQRIGFRNVNPHIPLSLNVCPILPCLSKIRNQSTISCLVASKCWSRFLVAANMSWDLLCL